MISWNVCFIFDSIQHEKCSNLFGDLSLIKRLDYTVQDTSLLLCVVIYGRRKFKSEDAIDSRLIYIATDLLVEW